MYKLIALDIDGTILNKEKKVTKEVFNAIQSAKKKGVKVVLSTGRPLPGVQNLLKELKLNDEENFVVTFNGGLVQEVTTQEVISNIEMEYEDFNLIYNELAQKHNIKIHINTPDSVVVPYKEYPKYSIHEATLNNIPVVSMNYEDINENINFCKVMLIDEPELIEDVITKIHGGTSAIGFMTLLGVPLLLAILQFQAINIFMGTIALVSFIVAFAFFCFFIMGEKAKFANTVLKYGGLWQRLVCSSSADRWAQTSRGR